MRRRHSVEPMYLAKVEFTAAMLDGMNAGLRFSGVGVVVFVGGLAKVK